MESASATLPLLFSGWFWMWYIQCLFTKCFTSAKPEAIFKHIYFCELTFFYLTDVGFSAVLDQNVCALFQHVWHDIVGMDMGCVKVLVWVIECCFAFRAWVWETFSIKETEQTQLLHWSCVKLLLFPVLLKYQVIQILYILTHHFSIVSPWEWLSCIGRSDHEHSDHNIRTKRWKSWLHCHKFKLVSSLLL